MLKSTDFDQEVLILFDAYVHGSIDRRAFLNRAAKFAVGTMTAAAMLNALQPQFAAAQLIKPDDSRLRIEHVAYPSPQGYPKTQAYVVQPARAGGAGGAGGETKRPGILVVHENRGLNPPYRGHYPPPGPGRLPGLRPRRPRPSGRLPRR